MDITRARISAFLHDERQPTMSAIDELKAFQALVHDAKDLQSSRVSSHGMISNAAIIRTRSTGSNSPSAMAAMR